MNPNEAGEKLSAAIKDAEAQLRSRIAAEIARVRLEHAALDPDHARQFEAGMLWMGAFITGIQDYDLQQEVEILAAREVQGTPTGHDNDPRCVCGTYRSEHQLCGCPEGFQTAASWAAELETIEEMDDWTFEQCYGDRS